VRFVDSRAQRSFEELGTELSAVPFCVFDLETTGLSPDTCAITEIGAVKYLGGARTATFHTLVNPGSAIPPSVTVMTGITHAMLIDAPEIEEALPSFLEFIGDAVLVGHNVRFDISFLNAAAVRLGYGQLTNRHTDTLRLARRLIRSDVRSLKLSHLAAYLGSPATPNHRALDDALATAHVFWSLLERAGAIGVTHLDDLLALPTIKGSRAIGKLALTQGLPRSPGVYTFRDRTGTAMYVGKATNLRTRVRSYFGGDERRRIDDMLRDLETIDYRETCAEVEAAVLELRAIAQDRPIYNRRSLPPRSLHWVRLTNERFPRLTVTRTPALSPVLLGPFRSQRAARAVQHALWDSTRIRRCTSRGQGCGFAGLSQAVCPCDGTTGPDTYGGIVDELIDGVARPALLIERTQERMLRLVDLQRFEDAAAVRDRWKALSRAVERSRVWTTFQQAQHIEASDVDGVSLTIDRGRLAAAWLTSATAPFTLPEPRGQENIPPSMVAIDEAMLLWKWLSKPGTRLLTVEGTLAVPVWAIPKLAGRHAIGVPGGTDLSGIRSTTPLSVSPPITSTSDRKPPTRIGSKPVTATI